LEGDMKEDFATSECERGYVWRRRRRENDE
jgi:hypothetical protein